MTLVIFSALFRATLVVLLYRLVTRYRHILSLRERIGAGFMGGTGFLTIWVILDIERQGTPFDIWAGLFFSVGASLFFWGFLDRKAAHEVRNEQAVEQAVEHFAGKTA